jgi:hypothetical protein
MVGVLTRSKGHQISVHNPADIVTFAYSAFAGKDVRCYPSLETLGKGLGVSDRQARDYVKELERPR